LTIRSLSRFYHKGLIMDFKEVVFTRKSTRSYQDKPIPQDVLAEMLEAARLAPSAQNRQPWRLIVIQSPEKIKQMAQNCGLIGLSNYFVRSAPCMIIACADASKDIKINGQEYYLVDTAIAFQQMILTAWSHGIGSCWLAAFSEKKLRSWLDIPKSWRIVALSPFGYPAEKLSVYAKAVKSFAGSNNRLPLEQIVRYLD
jgi:nitroreductase